MKAMQVKADAYEKINKDLLRFVEDMLLKCCEDVTERIEHTGSLGP